MKNIDKQALTEVVEILKHSEKEITDKIPEKFMQFLYKNMDNEYKANINFLNENWDNEIKQDTKAILALIYRDYIVTKDERAKLMEKEQEEIKQEEEKIREKYNPDNLFRKKEDVESEDTINDMQLIEIKVESWYKKIWKKIVSFFGKNK